MVTRAGVMAAAFFCCFSISRTLKSKILFDFLANGASEIRCTKHYRIKRKAVYFKTNEHITSVLKSMVEFAAIHLKNYQLGPGYKFNPKHVVMTRRKWKAIDKMMFNYDYGNTGLVQEMFLGLSSLNLSTFVNRLHEPNCSWIYDTE